MSLFNFNSKRHGTISVSIINDKLRFYCPHKREVYGESFKYTGDNEYVEFRYHPHPDKKMTAKEFSGFIDLVEADNQPSGKRRGDEKVYPKKSKSRKSGGGMTYEENLLLESFPVKVIREITKKLDLTDAIKFLDTSNPENYGYIIFRLSVFENKIHKVEKALVKNLRFDGKIMNFKSDDFPMLERVYFSTSSNINGVIGFGMLSGLKYLQTLILEGQGWTVNQVNEEVLKFLPNSITTIGISGPNFRTQLSSLYGIFRNQPPFKDIPYTVILGGNFDLIGEDIYISHLMSNADIIKKCTTMISRDNTFLKIRENESFEIENLIIQEPKQEINKHMLESFPNLRVFEFSGPIYYSNKTDFNKKPDHMNFSLSITHIHVFGDVVVPFHHNSIIIYSLLRVLRLPKYHWDSIGHIPLWSVPNLTVLELPVGSDLTFLPMSLYILVLTDLENLDEKYRYTNPITQIGNYNLPEQFPQTIKILSFSQKITEDYKLRITPIASNLINLVTYQGPVLTKLPESIENIYVGAELSTDREKDWTAQFDTKEISFIHHDFKLQTSWEKPWLEKPLAERKEGKGWLDWFSF